MRKGWIWITALAVIAVAATGVVSWVMHTPMGAPDVVTVTVGAAAESGRTVIYTCSDRGKIGQCEAKIPHWTFTRRVTVPKGATVSIRVTPTLDDHLLAPTCWIGDADDHAPPYVKREVLAMCTYTT